jgi:hypothetical protein
MMRRAPLKPGSGFKSQAYASIDRKEANAAAKLRKPMKSRGMKGRAPTADEQRFMDAIASLGCVACAKDGIENSRISLHHIDGRTKPGAHMLVLPLCAGHHQAGTGENKTLIAVHPDKARFEAHYGTQPELLAELRAALGFDEKGLIE